MYKILVTAVRTYSGMSYGGVGVSTQVIEFPTKKDAETAATAIEKDDNKNASLSVVRLW